MSISLLKKEAVMFVMEAIDSSEIETTLGAEKSKPIIKAFKNLMQLIKENKDNSVNQQSILETQQATLTTIKDNVDAYIKDDVHRKAEIKKDLLIELAAKADIEILNGKIDALEQKMNGQTKYLEQKMDGRIKYLEQKMDGEFKSMRLWLKMLLALAFLSIACFSPTAQTLIKLLKL